ncbi:MAG: hypothetical protein ABMA14_28360 [Hyphomonadaceae bacterium]
MHKFAVAMLGLYGTLGPFGAAAASAQTLEPTPWSSKTHNIALTLPPGWSATDSATPDAQIKLNKAPGAPEQLGGGVCYAEDHPLPRDAESVPALDPFVQTELNKDTKRLSLDGWLFTVGKQLHLRAPVWLESRPNSVVDGKLALTARGAIDRENSRTLIHLAQLVTPGRTYHLQCFFRTGVPPFMETPEFRAKTLAEFELILRTFHTPTP